MATKGESGNRIAQQISAAAAKAKIIEIANENGESQRKENQISAAANHGAERNKWRNGENGWRRENMA